MKPNNRLIFIPYRDVVTETALGGTAFTAGFRMHRAGDFMIVGIYICFDLLETDMLVDAVETFHVQIPLDSKQTEQDFIDTFSNSLVNLSFLDKDEKIGGFKIIRNPILF